MTERFGDFVLYKPPLKATTIALWAGPFVALAIALWLLLRRLQRGAAPASSNPLNNHNLLSDADRQRARALLNDNAPS